MRKAVSTEPLSRKFVWPDKCYCTGVHVAPIVEMLNAPPAVTRPASLAQGSDQPPQTFKESLLAASRASSDAGSVHEDGARTGRRQNPASDDTKLPHATLHSGCCRCYRLLLNRRCSSKSRRLSNCLSIDPAPVVPMQLPPGAAGDSPKAATVAAGPTPDAAVPKFPSIGSNIVQPVVAKPDNIASSHVQKQGDPPQAASTLPSLDMDHRLRRIYRPQSPNPPSNTVPGDAAGSTPSVVPGVAPECRFKSRRACPFQELFNRRILMPLLPWSQLPLQEQCQIQLQRPSRM